jgi:outer membrane protein TolC
VIGAIVARLTVETGGRRVRSAQLAAEGEKVLATSLDAWKQVLYGTRRVAAFLAMMAVAAMAQTVTPFSAPPVTERSQPGAPPVNPISGVVGAQNPFFGGVVSGTPSAEAIELSALDAIDRGLRYNLGLLLSSDQTESARGARYRALSDLLPNITSRLSFTESQINLAVLGFPGTLASAFGISPIVGPFSIYDARAFLSQAVLDLAAVNRNRAASDNLRAAQFSYRNARELVVLVVGASYLQAVADESRADAAQAQFNTAEALYKQAVDLKNAGVVAGIDLLRAQVEMQAQRQRLVATRNEFEKQKLALARAIGLPQGQQFKLTTSVPYAPVPPMTLAEAMQRAYANRPDYQQALALEQSAERSRAAAVAGYYPSVKINTDYGVIGQNVTQSHGTFDAGAALTIPIFQGGKVRGDVQEAEALLKQRKQEVEDLRARVENEIRSALLDLNAASEQVQVAEGTLQLAQEQLTQARDRFAAGVANNIDVVQAQESVATANENYISSLNIYNLARLALARGLGVAESATRSYLGGK